MRLYYSPFSSNARRARMTAIQLGLDFESMLVDLGAGAQRERDYLAINPNGKVPVLDDDGFILWESQAIMLYLCERAAGQTLYPTDLRAKADVHRWMFWSANHWGPAIAILNFERVVKGLIGAGSPDPEMERRGQAQLEPLAAVLDSQLAHRAWVTGDSLSLADISLGAPLMAMAPARIDLSAYSHLLAWFQRVQELESWKQTQPHF